MGINAASVAFGDYDNDGDQDMYVGTAETLQQNRLFRNKGNQNNWIKVKLVGTVSNRDGIGAHVKVVSDNLTQLREVTSATGYNSADDLPVEFGLGERTSSILPTSYTSLSKTYRFFLFHVTEHLI